jgi:hypothetical protein
MRDTNGVQFGAHGTIMSRAAFDAQRSDGGGSCGLEVWLQPASIAHDGTILEFSTAKSPRMFTMLQIHGDLVLRTEARNGEPHWIPIDNVLHSHRAVFITITSGLNGTLAYVDGALVRSTQAHLCWFSGRLVVGDSAVSHDTFRGQVLGLAIYGDELTAAQVRGHFESWTTKGAPDSLANEQCLALYLFGERRGDVVHSTVSPDSELIIPEKYALLRQIRLQPLWTEFRDRWSYWKDVAINVAGFVPLGVCFCAYFSLVRQMPRPAMATVVLGAAVSFTIEFLQSYLPTRDSGTTDLITNTFGTFIGVVLYQRVAASQLGRGVAAYFVRSQDEKR